MKKLIAGLLLIPCVAHAQFYTGNNLLQKMNSNDTVDRMVAMGYVMGISDVYQNTGHCSGVRVTAGQTRDVVKNYLEQNPAVRDMNADFITLVALGLAFPCPKDNSNTKRRSGT